MSKEQIEEMAEHMIEIQRSFNEYCAKPCRECEMAGIVNCENHYKAKALYNAGYRKQSEGEWIKQTKKTTSSVKGNEVEYHVYFCSKCGYEIGSISYHHKFCQNCGARMKNAGWRDDV